MKTTTIFFGALFIAGCSSMSSNIFEDTVGVGPDDNAILCVDVEVPGRFTGTTIRVKRLEFPAAFDMSTLTVEDIDDLEDKLCD
jgi:hypothetical protein